MRFQRATTSASLLAKSLNLAVSALERGISDSGVRDISLCHGSFGLSHIARRLSEVTGSRRLYEQARRWSRITYELFSDGLDRGYASYCDDKFGPKPRSCDYLLGASGAALALSTGIGSPLLAWDAPMMVDFGSRWRVSDAKSMGYMGP